jgi:hypothetical protein
MGTEDVKLPPRWLGWLRLALKLAVILAIAWCIHLLMDWATARVGAAGSGKLMIGLFAALLLAYALLIAVPFMPGIEIGISLLMMQGAAIAPLVYLATLLGLMMAFLAGRYLPHAWLRDLLADLRLKRACELVDRLAPMSRNERLAHLSERAPAWLRPLVGPWRYLLLAALINIPGNTVIGGGGGIAFTAGFSRLFRPGWTAFTMALAVVPVPIAVWYSGTGPLLP